MIFGDEPPNLATNLQSAEMEKSAEALSLRSDHYVKRNISAQFTVSSFCSASELMSRYAMSSTIRQTKVMMTWSSDETSERHPLVYLSTPMSSLLGFSSA